GPTSCNPFEQVKGVARAAAQRGIQVHVIVIPTPASACDASSVPADTSAFDAVAAAALAPLGEAAPKAIVLHGTDTALTNGFTDAVSTILERYRANVACRFSFPKMPDGFREHVVDVTYTDADGTLRSLPESRRDECSGFYYDTNTALDVCPK